MGVNLIDWNNFPKEYRYITIDRDGIFIWKDKPKVELVNGYFVYVGQECNKVDVEKTFEPYIFEREYEPEFHP